MVIEARNLSLDFPVHGVSVQSLRKAVIGLAVGGQFARRQSTVYVRALKNLSFKVEDGDRLGLLGHNGAGKSTLLRCIAKVYPPSSGEMVVKGEISTFFDPTMGMDLEATGRENIFLLGMYRRRRRKEVKAAADEIIDFSGLGGYIDLPVKTYSSGMVGRLAFSVATAFQPDVLLMDEWLSVGDADFMRKAEDRVVGLVENSRAMVVASHSTALIEHFCNKAILLHHGEIVDYGPASQVIARAAGLVEGVV
jgi:lipopolysaccharide transport system ATP-binding protein